MSTTAQRGRLDVMQELLALTKEMLRLKDDAEFLIRSVDKRQGLMDEYDTMQAQEEQALTSEEMQEAKRMAQEIVRMDGEISAALAGHRQQAKTDLAANTHHQRILSYMPNVVASSGSHMDFKK